MEGTAEGAYARYTHATQETWWNVIQGPVVVAVKPSLPEPSTAIFSPLIHGECKPGVAIIVGSAPFNGLMVPVLSSLLAEDILESNRDLLYKKAQCYLSFSFLRSRST